MICQCGQIVETVYESEGLCESCAAEYYEKFKLPGAYRPSNHNNERDDDRRRRDDRSKSGEDNRAELYKKEKR